MPQTRPRKHHFIPARVLQSFASGDAWRLVPPDRQAAVRALDSQALSSSDHRRHPLIVLELDSGHPDRLKRGTVGTAMQRDHLYAVHDYDDETDRAIAVWLLRVWTREEDASPLSTVEEVLALGRGVHLPSLIEEGIMGGFDGRWATILRKVSHGKRLSRPELAELRRGLQVSAMRSPSWRSWASQSFRRNLAGPLGALFGVPPHPPRRIADLGGGISTARVGKVLLENEWVLAVAGFTRSPNSVFVKERLRLELAVAPPEVPFVIPDSPMRPFVPNNPHTVRAAANLGLANGHTVGVYPLSPSLAIIASAKRALPSHRIVRRCLTETDARRINTGMLLGSEDLVILPRLDPRGLFLPGVETPQPPDTARCLHS